MDSFTWSTDGKKVYFIAPIKGTKQLFEVNFPGLTKIAVRVTQLTDGDFDVNAIIGFSGTSVLVTRNDMNHAPEVYSYDLAQATIVFYRNNWSIDDTIINTGAYQSLPSSLKKFWTPIYDFRNNITSYERAKLDTVVETNKVVQVTHSGASDVFDYGEVVKQGTNSGVVSGVLSNSFLIEKVECEFTTGTVTNFDGSATTTATAVATINQSIPTAQVVYYSPVYAYDYEEEINEQRKEIYILDRAYLNQIELEMKTLLR